MEPPTPQTAERPVKVGDVDVEVGVTPFKRSLQTPAAAALKDSPTLCDSPAYDSSFETPAHLTLKTSFARGPDPPKQASPDSPLPQSPGSGAGPYTPPVKLTVITRYPYRLAGQPAAGVSGSGAGCCPYGSIWLFAYKYTKVPVQSTHALSASQLMVVALSWTLSVSSSTG
jgi:hypothetical protein